ncbi:IclR family transcriptional regulator [Streptomyces brasiliensis]|uniref:Transcriptional regulator n=1 Tax=Streptomyces brasiliensis TaxID=1954 RepID=A0A917KV45_9ACTN|nr:helix-turn-helix domain-containing protein [Streptomyces brasiliensis]GGJ30827.1 transcriptional regulator [Streptomyces brasiliensis]
MTSTPSDEAGAGGTATREAASRKQGSQTLARGLRALELVAGSETGLTVQEIAAELGVHRTIAYRLLATLDDFRLVARNGDGRFHAGAGLSALAHQVQRGLREATEPHLRTLARELQSTISLVALEGDEAVAISVIEPPNATYHISFRAGSRHPLDRGAAGLALRAAFAAAPGEPAAVAEVRARGFARTRGEVEPEAYGVAVPLRTPPGMPVACINLITYRAELAERSAPLLLECAALIDADLA